MDARPGHAYQAPTASDSRSPCPALNAAANHGYLPHDGKNISVLQLIGALREVYNLSYPLAATLALGGVLICGNKLKLTLDLSALDAHGKIEHDASLAHQDLKDGDNVHPSQLLLDELIALSTDGKGLTLDDFAKARAKRELRLPGGKLDRLHSGIASGESVMVVQVMGDGNEVSVETIREWFGNEKLPHNWMPHGQMASESYSSMNRTNLGHQGLINLSLLNRKFAKTIEQAKQNEKSQ